MKADTGALGKIYEDGEIIIRQGEVGHTMHVIQEGTVEVFLEGEDGEVHLGELSDGDFVGEMALFDRETRSATVRAKGAVRIITIDKKNFLARVHSDPSLAFRLVEMMSLRIRELEGTLQKITAALKQVEG